MSEPDSRRWSLRDPDADTSTNGITTALLAQWAASGVIRPGFLLSSDGEHWVPAETLPELGMTWYVLSPGCPPYGPITRSAAERFVAAGNFPHTAILTQDPGPAPVSADLPLPQETPPTVSQEAYDELQMQAAMLEKELRQRDRRIEELNAEVAALRQDELNVEGRPDPDVLQRENDALRSELARLAESSRADTEAAARREGELRQRIETLETALAARETAPAEATAEGPDAITFAILSKEADCLRQGQEEEQELLDRLREITRTRMLHFSERLLEIRKLMGDSPEAMREKALRDGRIASLALRNMPNERAHELEKSLANALTRESELQKRLVALESREQDLRTQMEAAEQRTLDSVRLGEKLRETAAAFERERRARDTDHQEFMHIQEQLLRRIEELERTSGGYDALTARPDEPGSARPVSHTAAFGWLRQK